MIASVVRKTDPCSAINRLRSLYPCFKDCCSCEIRRKVSGDGPSLSSFHTLCCPLPQEHRGLSDISGKQRTIRERHTPAHIRLAEELGVQTEIEEVGHFVYRHVFENGMTEYEFDHVLLGRMSRSTPLSPAPEEADAVEWVSVEELARQLTKTPEKFTPWFITAAPSVLDHLNR